MDLEAPEHLAHETHRRKRLRLVEPPRHGLGRRADSDQLRRRRKGRRRSVREAEAAGVRDERQVEHSGGRRVDLDAQGLGQPEDHLAHRWRSGLHPVDRTVVFVAQVVVDVQDPETLHLLGEATAVEARTWAFRSPLEITRTPQ